VRAGAGRGGHVQVRPGGPAVVPGRGGAAAVPSPGPGAGCSRGAGPAGGARSAPVAEIAGAARRRATARGHHCGSRVRPGRRRERKGKQLFGLIPGRRWLHSAFDRSADCGFCAEDSVHDGSAVRGPGFPAFPVPRWVHGRIPWYGRRCGAVFATPARAAARRDPAPPRGRAPPGTGRRRPDHRRAAHGCDLRGRGGRSWRRRGAGRGADGVGGGAAAGAGAGGAPAGRGCTGHRGGVRCEAAGAPGRAAAESADPFRETPPTRTCRMPVINLWRPCRGVSGRCRRGPAGAAGCRSRTSTGKRRNLTSA
jgi:hypothetical protein